MKNALMAMTLTMGALGMVAQPATADAWSFDPIGAIGTVVSHVEQDAAAAAAMVPLAGTLFEGGAGIAIGGLLVGNPAFVLAGGAVMIGSIGAFAGAMAYAELRRDFPSTPGWNGTRTVSTTGVLAAGVSPVTQNAGFHR